MNAIEILEVGHGHVVKAIDGLADGDWEIPKVTTSWSVKDTIGHLGAYELLLENALRSVIEPGGPTPMLDKSKASGAGFNDGEATARKEMSFDVILAEYTQAYEHVMALARQLSPERLREPGTIPWYGETYSLDDFIVYANYAHKREHTAQIRLFRKREGV